MPVALALSVLLTSQSPSPATLPAGTVITESTKIAPGQYLRPSPEGGPALVIRGDGITIDFQNALLMGTPTTVEPDQRKGIGILVEGKNIVLRNLRIRGYKVAVMVQNSPGFMLLDSDLSYNWKQKLQSTLERENSADWMSFHKNENDEWLRFGAGVYLKNSDNFKLRDVIVRGGQCGAMLTNSNRGLIINSDFSFLSAIGIGLYRSSENTILHNSVDWCVRGYSHGRWNRGQDSAGILMYEQSHQNIVAYNSVTHGGDGFFLWAGQTTMDTGEGGCNDNLLYGNDFSHAPTNGIEATFSRNDFINNLIQECWHGVWGGYSYNSNIIGNQFALNATGIAIEHGQDNTINHNRFSREVEAIELWSRPSQPADWGYAANRDVSSRHYEVRGNAFEDITNHVFDLRGVKGVRVINNTFRANQRVLNANPVVEDLGFHLNQIRHASDPSREEISKLAPSAPGVNRNTWIASPTSKPKPAWMHPSGNVRTEIESSTRDYLRTFRQGWNPIKEVMSPHVKRFWVTPDPGGRNPFLKQGSLRGRRYILVNEWGPYDFRSPILWPRSESRIGGKRVIKFEVLGPFGRWHIRDAKGMTLSSRSGQVPGSVEATITSTKPGLRSVDLEFIGREAVDYRGVRIPARTPVKFGWSEFHFPLSWNVRFWPYDKDTQDPRTQSAEFAQILTNEPAHRATVNELAYDFYGEPYPGGPRDHFASVAETAFTAPTGDYHLAVSADDGVRVYLDDTLIVDEWKYSGPTTYEREVRLSGMHRIRIEHFELDGFAQLKFKITPAQ